MNEKAEKGKTKQNGVVIVNIIAYILATASILVDIAFDFDSSTLSDLVSIMYPTVITVSGFLITVYILFLEIYKDRYPLEKMQKKNFPSARYYLSAVIYNIIVGFAVLYIGEGFASFVLFCITSLSTIVAILCFVFKSNKSLMLTSYIESFCNDITREFESSQAGISKSTIQNIQNVLDECVIKEEYHTVGVIVEKTGEIFGKFLENSISDLSDKRDLIADTFDQIVDLNIFELKLCKTIKSSQLIKKIVKQQHKNLFFCIDNFQVEWYKKYFAKYLRCFYKIQEENLTEVASLMYASFSCVIIRLYEKKNKGLAEKTIEDIHDANRSFVFINKRGNSKLYIQFLYSVVEYSIEEKDKELLDLLIKIIGQYIFALVKNSNSFIDIVEYYKLIFDSILTYDIEKAIVLYENCADVFSYNNMQTSALVECNMFCLSRLSEENQDEKKHEDKFMEYYIELIYQVSKMKDKYTGYLFSPNFDSMIKSNDGNVEQIKIIAGHMKRILNQCILGDNVPLFYEFIEKLNTILIKTKIQQRFIQEGMLSLYFWLIPRTRQLVNKQFLEITFSKLDVAIEELDNKKAISEAVGNYIIEQLRESCKINTFHNEESSIEIIHMLSEFMLQENPYYFVVARNVLKKLLYKTLFNIGTDCIENGFEDGVRYVSNSLGWLTIKSIESGNDELAMYLIGRVSELYNIATTMEISHKTRMFMLTLFPTVGAFCHKNAGYSKYINPIINAIKNEPMINVETAVRLRTSENDMWNNLYEGRTDELTGKFMEKYRKQYNRE